MTLYSLLNADGQNLRASDHVVERGRRRFVDGGLVRDDHVLGSAHAIHHVHDGERERGHNFVSDHGLGVSLEQRDVDAVVDVFLVQEGDGGSQIQLASEKRRAATEMVERVAIADQDAERSLEVDVGMWMGMCCTTPSPR